MENISLSASDGYYNYSHRSKIKRLSDSINHKRLSLNLQTIHIPEMSKKMFKRWCEARDAYLNEQYFRMQEHRKIKQNYNNNNNINNKEILSISTFEKQQSPVYFIDRSIGTEINESVLCHAYVKQENQVDLLLSSSPQSSEINHDDGDVDINPVEDIEQQQQQQQQQQQTHKALQTHLTLNMKKEDEPIDENIRDNPSIDSTISQSNDDADTKTIISSSRSNTSVYKQFRILRLRFKRLSHERRLLCCLLSLYFIIMCGLLIIIFLLLWTFQRRSLILYKETSTIDTNIYFGVAQYGESCVDDHDCQRPFICYKRKSSSGICRCPWQYDLVNNQCVGDLNALCSKDIDCQRYMLCSGMEDGTRRCHCQTLYSYDIDRKQCYGDYHASCENNNDCRANLICNTTSIPSTCSCQINYRYSSLEHKCRGDPGAICEVTAVECTDNAACRDGVCECAFQFVSDENKLCVDPCLKISPNPIKIRYPGDCRRFIDCQQRSKGECPEPTIFNFRTQLCDYPKNVLDCR